MPLIHDRPTGGSVYNRQVLGHLAASMQVELHLDSPAVDRSRWAGGLWLVDSLCLDSGAAHIEQCPDAVAVLIAHYLHVLDPRRQFSRRAAAELEMMKRYRAVVATSRFVDSALPTAGFPGGITSTSPRKPAVGRALFILRLVATTARYRFIISNSAAARLENCRRGSRTWR